MFSDQKPWEMFVQRQKEKTDWNVFIRQSTAGRAARLQHVWVQLKAEFDSFWMSSQLPPAPAPAPPPPGQTKARQSDRPLNFSRVQFTSCVFFFFFLSYSSTSSTSLFSTHWIQAETVGVEGRAITNQIQKGAEPLVEALLLLLCWRQIPPGSQHYYPGYCRAAVLLMKCKSVHKLIV